MYYTRDCRLAAMVVLTIVVVTVLSLLLELVAFRPVRNASPITLLVTSFAVSYGLQQLAWMTVGRGPQKGVEPYPWLTVQMDIGGVRISRLAILTMVVAIVLLVGDEPHAQTHDARHPAACLDRGLPHGAARRRARRTG